MKKNKITTFRNITTGLFAFALLSLTAPAFSQSGEKLAKDGWQATASHNSDKAKKAIDNDANSRWDSGAPQAPGQWFQLDMGTVQPISEIVLTYEKSNNDGPRAYEVLVSNDGKKWKSVAESASASPKSKLEINLRKSAKARYIKIAQNGSTGGTFWSIHEIEVYKK